MSDEVVRRQGIKTYWWTNQNGCLLVVLHFIVNVHFTQKTILLDLDTGKDND